MRVLCAILALGITGIYSDLYSSLVPPLLELQEDILKLETCSLEELHTYLCKACAGNNELLVKRILCQKIPLGTCENEYGMTPLAFALTTSSRDVIKLLREAGASDEQLDKSGRTLLHYLALFQVKLSADRQFVRHELFLKQDLINQPELDRGRTVLHYSIVNGSLLILYYKLLQTRNLTLWAKVHHLEKLAALKELKKLVKRLKSGAVVLRLILAAGASTAALDFEQRTPLDYAVAHGNSHFVGILLAQSFFTQAALRHALVQAQLSTGQTYWTMLNDLNYRPDDKRRLEAYKNKILSFLEQYYKRNRGITRMLRRYWYVQRFMGKLLPFEIAQLIAQYTVAIPKMLS